jgi:hypothetical protein
MITKHTNNLSNAMLKKIGPDDKNPLLYINTKNCSDFLLHVKLSTNKCSLYTKLPGTKGLIQAPTYNVSQLYAFCIYPMHAIFHNYPNMLHITTTMMLAEKNVLTVEFIPFF